jgi:hypothetical protein
MQASKIAEYLISLQAIEWQQRKAGQTRTIA